MASEFGELKSHQSGIAQWAAISTHNSERDVQRVVSKQKTTLEVPITELNVQGSSVPWISPKAWMQYIVSHGLVYMLSGLHQENRHLIGTVWKEFWTRFEILHPGFGLFKRRDINLDFGTTIALYIHGDEGRTLKKQGLMVTTLQSILGFGFSGKRQKDSQAPSLFEVNFAGNICLSRFVVSVIPKWQYQSNPSFFHDIMQKMTCELLDLLETGITCPLTNTVYRFCVIGVKGDMPYLQKMGHLKRSWNTTVKRGTARQPPKGVCHLCLAGTTGIPAEDTRKRPCWSHTVGSKLPFDTIPSVIRLLPHDEDHAGSFFKPDIWHIIHLGVGKSFIASTIQVSLETVPGSNMDERFEFLTQHYVRWCRRTRRSCFITKLSPYVVSYNETAGATGNWSKGSVTTNLMLWVVELIQDLQPDSQGWLRRASEGAKSLNTILKLLYNSTLFLERGDCLTVCHHGQIFLDTYTGLARDCFASGRSQLYPLFPKIHALHHFFHGIRLDVSTYNYSMNPLSSSCQLDEDTIGKVSRVSRRVNIRTLAMRTLQRHLMTCWKVWKGAEILV